MDNTFEPSEKLYRAVYPPEIADIFWKRDGSISSAAFADPHGLSVDRGDYRDDEVVVSAFLIQPISLSDTWQRNFCYIIKAAAAPSC